MTTGEIVITAFVAFASTGLSVLVWGTFRLLKQELAQVRTDLRAEISTLDKRLSGEIASGRSEMRQEFAAMRSDMTHIALAVGASRPQATEG